MHCILRYGGVFFVSLKIVDILRDIGEKVHCLFLTLNELTSQEFNELHPLPNEVIILHEHLSY